MTNSERHDAIVTAARATFLQFGFAKTSMDDIAKRAGISRPLVYRTFKNKEDILMAVFDQLHEGDDARVNEVLESRSRPREKLMGLYEIFYLEPWDELMRAPMAAELYEACMKIDPTSEAKRARKRHAAVQRVVGTKEVAEVFDLAVDGMSVDLPTTSVLRKRITILAERFVP